MMKDMSFFDKLNILGDVISSSNMFIIGIILFIIIGFLFITTNKTNYKSSKRTYLLIYISIITFLIITYKDSLSNMFDYMMNNLFIAVYFPNLAIYFAAIIITNVIVWISMFNFNVSKLIKSINVVVFCIIHYLLILILNIVTEKKLDVFQQSSVYGNKQAFALIELSSTIFIVWIIFLILYKIIKKYITKEETIEVEENTNKNNINKTKAPYVLKQTPSIQNEEKTTDFENLLTLDDYKLLLNMLREKKQEIKEDEVKEQEIDNQNKFMELQALYKSIDS